MDKMKKRYQYRVEGKHREFMDQAWVHIGEPVYSVEDARALIRKAYEEYAPEKAGTKDVMKVGMIWGESELDEKTRSALEYTEFRILRREITDWEETEHVTNNLITE